MDAVGAPGTAQLAAVQALVASLGPTAPVAPLAASVVADPRKQLQLAALASSGSGLVDVYA